MSGIHDARHEEVVRDVFLGERSRENEVVAALLRDCAECRELLSAADSDLQNELDEFGVLDAADPRDVDSIVGFLQKLSEEEPLTRSRSRAWMVATAAAIVICLFGVFAYNSGDKSGAPVFIGDEELSLIGPRDGVARYELFEWVCAREDLSSFTLMILDDTEEGMGREHLVLNHLKESSWKPTKEERLAMPARIKWRVDAYGPFGPTGDPVATSSFVASWLD